MIDEGMGRRICYELMARKVNWVGRSLGRWIGRYISEWADWSMRK